MAKRLCLIVFVLAIACSSSVFASQYLVLFKGGGAPADFASQVTVAGGRVEFQHSVLAVVSGLDDASASGLTGVADIQPDIALDLQVERDTADVAFAWPESVANPTLARFYPRQWHLWAIGANVAWAAGRVGSPDVTVAVLDTGIDRRSNPHPDLAGHVDYVRGKQFERDNTTCIPPGFTFDATDDLMFHGTHVASTISSNAVAAAGVTSKVTLVPVKVLGLVRDSRYDPKEGAFCSGGSGYLGSILSGVLYAADIDADVANMSLGGGFGKAGNGRYVGIINQVINYAFRQGMVVVVAAGNSAADLDHDVNFLATYCEVPNTVCVSATGPSKATLSLEFEKLDSFAGYSNFGRSAISVAAPGGTGSGNPAAQRQRGYVTAACSRSAVSTGLAVCGTGTFVVGSNGTSMAAPHVSGLAALIVEQVGKNRPALVKSILRQSADDLGRPGVDPYYGSGRINVPRALGLQ